MGIKEKGFADWISTTFPDVVKHVAQTDKSFFEAVCIDVNPLLHTCMRKAKDESKFVKLLFADLDRCLRLTIPQAIVYLAVDGSPPLAKMKEQIRRRRSKAPSKDKHMDSSQITPGCSFQLRVTQYLHYYAARYLSTKHHPRNLQFIVDGAETPGEGEAKIMRFLYGHHVRFVSRLVAVYSGDSDVIIQSLLNPVQDIFVLRPGEGHFVVHAVRGLRHAICKSTNTTTLRTVKDFCLLAMFSGNDYIHKLRGGGMSKAWPVYRQYRIESTSSPSWYEQYLLHIDGTLDLVVLAEILTRIRRLTNRRVFKPDLTISLAMLGITSQPENGDTLEASISDSDSDDPDDQLAAASVTKEQKMPGYTKHIRNYLEALLWTLHMYGTGSCSDVTFTQVGHYLTTEQILTFLVRDLGTRRQIELPVNNWRSFVRTGYCSIALLSKEKQNLVPVSWHRMFSSDVSRLCTNSIIHETTLQDERHRVESLFKRLDAETIIKSNWESQIVCTLTDAQYATTLSQSRRKSQWDKPREPLGDRYPEIWHGIIINLPALKDESTVFLRDHEVLYPKHVPVPAEDIGLGTQTRWPFSPRIAKSTFKQNLPKLNHQSV